MVALTDVMHAVERALISSCRRCSDGWRWYVKGYELRACEGREVDKGESECALHATAAKLQHFIDAEREKSEAKVKQRDHKIRPVPG